MQVRYAGYVKLSQECGAKEAEEVKKCIAEAGISDAEHITLTSLGENAMIVFSAKERTDCHTESFEKLHKTLEGRCERGLIVFSSDDGLRWSQYYDEYSDGWKESERMRCSRGYGRGIRESVI